MCYQEGPLDAAVPLAAAGRAASCCCHRRCSSGQVGRRGRGDSQAARAVLAGALGGASDGAHRHAQGGVARAGAWAWWHFANALPLLEIGTVKEGTHLLFTSCTVEFDSSICILLLDSA
jgi:hypothetical protein